MVWVLTRFCTTSPGCVGQIARCIHRTHGPFSVCAPGVGMTDVDPRATRKSEPQKVFYYAVVNAVLGPIYFE